MIELNTPMIQKQSENKLDSAQKTKPAAPPNERTGLNIDEHVKIFDPETKKVWLEKRA